MRRLLPFIVTALACTGASDSASIVPPTPPPSTQVGTITLSYSSAPAGTQAIRLHLIARGMGQLSPVGATRILTQRIVGDTADLLMILPALGENLISFRTNDRDGPFVAQIVEASAGRPLDYVAIPPGSVQLGIRRQ
jgi:hypothetical protein